MYLSYPDGEYLSVMEGLTHVRKDLTLQMSFLLPSLSIATVQRLTHLPFLPVPLTISSPAQHHTFLSQIMAQSPTADLSWMGCRTAHVAHGLPWFIMGQVLVRLFTTFAPTSGQEQRWVETNSSLPLPTMLSSRDRSHHWSTLLLH